MLPNFSTVSGSNIVAGNINGIGISDLGATTSMQQPFFIFNNDIVDNTVGLYNISSHPNATGATNPIFQAYVQNNIFYSNHDLTSARSGTGIDSLAANTLAVGTNLFYQNGPNNNAASNAIGSFAFSPTASFVPSALTSSPDIMGNLIGNPFFAMALDPRPDNGTPATFFSSSNFDLTSRSVAINAANNVVAPATDFLYRTPVAIAGHGFPNTGPASIGAFYFNGISVPAQPAPAPESPLRDHRHPGNGGWWWNWRRNRRRHRWRHRIWKRELARPAQAQTGTGSTGKGSLNASSVTGSNGSTVSSPIGGGIALGTKQFTVVNTSLDSNGTLASNGILVENGPSYIDVNFSDNINASTLNPTDLVLSGDGLNSTNPAQVTSFAWIDDHAVRFYLSGMATTPQEP